MCPSHLSESGFCYETAAVLSFSSALCLPCGGNHYCPRGVHDPRRQWSGGRPSAPPDLLTTQGNLNYTYITPWSIFLERGCSTNFVSLTKRRVHYCLHMIPPLDPLGSQSTSSYIISLGYILIVLSHLCQGRPSGLFLPGLPSKSPNVFNYTMRGTYTVLLDKITINIFR